MSKKNGKINNRQTVNWLKSHWFFKNASQVIEAQQIKIAKAKAKERKDKIAKVTKPPQA